MSEIICPIVEIQVDFQFNFFLNFEVYKFPKKRIHTRHLQKLCYFQCENFPIFVNREPKRQFIINFSIATLEI